MTRIADRVGRLEGLLLEMFQHPRDVRKVWGAAFGEQANSEINWDQALKHVVFDIIMWLQARGMLAEFFRALRSARVGRRTDIAQIEELFAVSSEAPARDDRAALHVLLLRFERLMLTERALFLERTLEKHLKRFAESQGMALDVTASDDEAPLELANVLSIGQRLGADIVIWGDVYDLENSVEFELRWATPQRPTLPAAAQPEGTTGIATVQSLSVLTSGRLLGQVDFLVAWIAGMQRFNAGDYDAAARFFESAIRFVAGSFNWHYKFSMTRRGFEFLANRPWVDALAFLALSYQGADRPEQAVPVWETILTMEGESSQGSFSADPFLMAVAQGDAENSRAFAVATLQYAHALRAAGKAAEALAAYRKLHATVSKNASEALSYVLPETLTGYARLVSSTITNALGKPVVEEIQILLLFDDMAVPAAMAQAVTRLGGSECELLLNTLSAGKFIETWTDENCSLRFEQIFLRAIKETNLDREAEALRRLADWLAQEHSEISTDDRLWPALQYLLDSGPAFFTGAESLKIGSELSRMLSADRSAWWVEATRTAEIPPIFALVLHQGEFESARAMSTEMVRAALGFAIKARRDSSPLAQTLAELGLDPGFWTIAPEWLRSHMTLLATSGVYDHSVDVPLAYLIHVGAAWSAVQQEGKSKQA